VAVNANRGQDGKYKRTSRYQSIRSCEARVELHTRGEARFEMFHEPAVYSGTTQAVLNQAAHEWRTRPVDRVCYEPVL
jgi:hypothetical protein